MFETAINHYEHKLRSAATSAVLQLLDEEEAKKTTRKRQRTKDAVQRKQLLFMRNNLDKFLNETVAREDKYNEQGVASPISPTSISSDQNEVSKKEEALNGLLKTNPNSCPNPNPLLKDVSKYMANKRASLFGDDDDEEALSGKKKPETEQEKVSFGSSYFTANEKKSAGSAKRFESAKREEQRLEEERMQLQTDLNQTVNVTLPLAAGHLRLHALHDEAISMDTVRFTLNTIIKDESEGQGRNLHGRLTVCFQSLEILRGEVQQKMSSMGDADLEVRVRIGDRVKVRVKG